MRWLKQPGFWDVDHRLQELSGPWRSAGKTGRDGRFRDVPRRPYRRAWRARSGEGRTSRLRSDPEVPDAGAADDAWAFTGPDRISCCATGSPGCVSAGSALATRCRMPTQLWDFREALIAANAFDALFERLNLAITEAGYLPMSGQIVDATLGGSTPPAQHRGRKGPDQRGQGCQGNLAGEAGPAPVRRTPMLAGRSSLQGQTGGRRQQNKWTSPFRHSVTSPMSPSTGGTGIIRRQTVTDAAAHDGARLRAGLIDRDNTACVRLGRYGLPQPGQ